MEEDDFSVDTGALIWKAFFSAIIGAIFVAFAFGVVIRIASILYASSFLSAMIGWVAFASLIIGGLVAGIVVHRSLKHEINIAPKTWLVLSILFWASIPFGISMSSFVYGTFLFILPQSQVKMSTFFRIMQYLAPVIGLATWTILAAIFVKRSTAVTSRKKNYKFYNMFALNALFGLAIFSAASLGSTVLRLVGPSILLATVSITLYILSTNAEKQQRLHYLLVLWAIPALAFVALVLMLGPEIYGFQLF